MGGSKLSMEINSRILATAGGLALLLFSVMIAGMVEIRGVMLELKGAYPLINSRLDRQDDAAARRETRYAKQLDDIEKRLRALERGNRGNP